MVKNELKNKTSESKNKMDQNNNKLFEHVNSMSVLGMSSDQSFASKGYILHLAMYGISLMGELNELRR